MRKPEHEPIRVVEAAYRLEGDDEAWLAACAPGLVDDRDRSLRNGGPMKRFSAIADGKLGARSRVQIVDRFTSLRYAKFAPLESDTDEWHAAAVEVEPPRNSPLTAAEDEVAQMASRGVSNDRIARTRGCSPRTVATR